MKEHVLALDSNQSGGHALPGLARFLVALMLASTPVSASAQRGIACDDATEAWVRRCAESSGLPLEADVCGGARLVVRAASGEAETLFIEIEPRGARGFLRVGTVAISPIVEVADWSATPAPWQRALDAVAACVQRDEPPVDSRDLPAHGDREDPNFSFPWRAALGALAFGALCVLDRRRLRAAVGAVVPRSVSPMGLLVASILTTLMVRSAISPAAFFHQNGHGPTWIDQGLCHQSMYGPGYREMFSGVAYATAPASEEGVFLLQRILGALGPALTFLLVRAARGSTLLAATIALLVLLDPVTARSTSSESYFALQTSLLVWGVTALAWGMGARGHGCRALGTLAAGLLLSQSARVHPLGWLPAALTPLVVFCLRGSWRSLASRAALGGLGIGLTVLLTSGGTLWATLHGPLFMQWGAQAASAGGRHAVPALGLGALVISLVLARARARARAASLGAILVAISLVVAHATAIAPWPEIVWQANLRLHTALILACCVGVLVGIPGGRRASLIVAAVLAVSGGTWLVTGAERWLELPTDALEQRIAVGWREQMEADASVVYVARADRRIAALPFYACVGRGPRGVALDVRQDGSRLSAAGATYWAETSICSTPEGADACRTIRASAPMTLVHERTLLARPSTPHLPYEVGSITVRLWRVRSAAPPRPSDQ